MCCTIRGKRENGEEAIDIKGRIYKPERIDKRGNNVGFKMGTSHLNYSIKEKVYQ